MRVGRELPARRIGLSTAPHPDRSLSASCGRPARSATAMASSSRVIGVPASTAGTVLQRGGLARPPGPGRHTVA